MEFPVFLNAFLLSIFVFHIEVDLGSLRLLLPRTVNVSDHALEVAAIPPARGPTQAEDGGGGGRWTAAGNAMVTPASIFADYLEDFQDFPQVKRRGTICRCQR